MTGYYINSNHHVLDELILVDLILHKESMRIQQVAEAEFENDLLNGLFITREKLEKLISDPSIPVEWFETFPKANSAGKDMQAVSNAILIQKEKIDKRINETLKKGITLNLLKVKSNFGITDEEYFILNIGLAVHLLPKYEKIFAYLHDNAARKLPSVDTILTILNHTFLDKLSSADYFSFESPLIANRIILFHDDLHENRQLSSLRQVKISKRIADYILNRSSAQKQFSGIVEYFSPEQYKENLSIDNQPEKDIHLFIETNKDEFLANNQGYMFHFCGPYGSGKKDYTKSVGYNLDLPLLFVDMDAALKSDQDIENLFVLINRESILLDSILCFYDTDRLFKDKEHSKSKNHLLRALSHNDRLIIIHTQDKHDIRSAFGRKQFFYKDFTVPSYKKRVEFWHLYMQDESLVSGYRVSEKVNVNLIAGKFRFTQGQIKDALKTAHNMARWQPNDKKMISEKNIYKGCHLQSNQNLKSLAREITTNYTLDDIVLPNDQKNQLKEIINRVKNKYVVYDEMGFSKRMTYGKGLNILLSGSSGTGKTMASAIIANTLNLEIYEINISQILSKFVGETEKRLAEIFRSARNAVIFFDEADALFGRRTKIKDAHDRYANIETSFLLREIEKYEEGCVLLATNRKDNMDEAFARRMDFDIEFPFPEKSDRMKIWQNIFPKQTLLDKHIDFEFLSEKFNLSGGNIHNIALASAFYAAQDQKIIKMHHIILAVKREYQKLNKLCNKSQFDKYCDLIN